MSKEYIGLIETFPNTRKLHEIYFFEEIFFVSCMFLVRGIVDKIKDIINKTVILTRLQKVILDNSSSPKDTV